MRRYGSAITMDHHTGYQAYSLIVQKIGTCNYFVKVKGQIWKRHIDQLRLHHVIDKLTLTENIGYFQPVNRMKVP